MLNPGNALPAANRQRRRHLQPLDTPHLLHLMKLFLSFVASFRSGRIGSAIEPSLPQADDATSATSSEDAERVVDHGIQAGFVGALISAVVMI